VKEERYVQIFRGKRDFTPFKGTGRFQRGKGKKRSFHKTVKEFCIKNITFHGYERSQGGRGGEEAKNDWGIKEAFLWRLMPVQRWKNKAKKALRGGTRGNL